MSATLEADYVNSYRLGANLSESARKLVRPDDVWKVSLIDGLSPAYKRSLWGCFLVKDWKHYKMNARDPWKEQELYFLGEHLHHSPTRVEWRKDVRDTGLLSRSLLVYVLTCPDRVELRNNLGGSRKALVEEFLRTAQEVSGIRYSDFFGSDRFVVEWGAPAVAIDL